FGSCPALGAAPLAPGQFKGAKVGVFCRALRWACAGLRWAQPAGIKHVLLRFAAKRERNGGEN
ncbi:hypothetical protein A2U01_0056435, partial [Trifolium medium]|nr:hypothetical protein [Trifolium medium]